ncbi:MAG: C45 family peptidase [Ferruginibacter sp.]
MNTIPEIILSGNAYERGLQHGRFLGPKINDFLNDNRARINSIRQVPLEEELMQGLVLQHAAVIEAQLPEIALELKGLAAGANISYEDAVLLQVRVELIAWNEQDILEGDCSTLAFNIAPHSVITGQTIDLPGNMTELGCIFRIIPEKENSPEILMYGFAGLLGYMGLNSYGLSININMVVSAGWQPGVSPYLLVRHLLKLSTIEECLHELVKIKRSSSRSFLIADEKRILAIELTGNHLRTIEDTVLLHTNHYLDHELAKEDKMHFLFKNSSIKRLRLLQQLLPDELGKITPEMLFNILSDHTLYPVGICAHGEGNIRRSETVGAVVMEPGKFALHARKGNSCTAITETFKIMNEIDKYHKDAN